MNSEKKWVVREPGNPAIVRQLTQELGVDPVLVNLLVQRGIKTYPEARAFFRPDLSMLHDPFLMKDMEEAVNRLHKAVTSGEKILIYGDYDVDGTTAVSLMYLFLKPLTSNLDYYIPDRYDEGSGVSYQSLDWAKEHGFTLLITLDCGIKAIKKVEYAREKGIDVIICDHHLQDTMLPPAVAVLDPKREECQYPFDELTGCGVGFKLAQAYSQRYGIPLERVFSLLDLLVISIACDLASVTGENRVLAHFGLKLLNGQNLRKGVQSVVKLSGLENHEISIDEIVFKIGPRINAAGRMESGRTAVDLLTSDTEEAAKKIGDEINVRNNDRKSIDRENTLEAIKMVRNSKELSSKKSTVVYNPDWHKGVVGIVASRLVESFCKPTVVLTKSRDDGDPANINTLITGSARTIPGFDLYEAVESCSDLLENFGGHMYAVGLTMKEENLKKFTERFEKYSEEHIRESMITPVVNIDSYLDFKQITPKFFGVLKQFQPFGPGNLSPVFCAENVYDDGNGRKVGPGSGHLKLELIQEDGTYRPFSAIAFNKSEHFDHLKAGNPIDICYSIAENKYRGIANVQLRIKDIKDKEFF